ncbi:hypothetical protein VTI74DRAFT_139 [Chaetomium olivicolor]
MVAGRVALAILKLQEDWMSWEHNGRGPGLSPFESGRQRGHSPGFRLTLQCPEFDADARPGLWAAGSRVRPPRLRNTEDRKARISKDGCSMRIPTVM